MTLLSYIFYRSIVAFIFLLPIVVLFIRNKKRSLIIKRKEKLSLQFKEMMISVITNLEAGNSVENALIGSYKDMVLLFGKEAMISKELLYMTRCIKNNRTVEDLLGDFGCRSHIKDIQDFAEIFKIAKRSGGDLAGMIRSTVDIISEKMDVKRRIYTLVSAKKFEQSIMNVVPFGIILYIDMTSPGFFNGLYGNLVGVLIMSLMLLIYMVAYYMAGRILEIEV